MAETRAHRLWRTYALHALAFVGSLIFRTKHVAIAMSKAVVGDYTEARLHAELAANGAQVQHTATLRSDLRREGNGYRLASAEQTCSLALA